jgi:putative transposase
MGQSLSNILTHIIFSTKDRQPFIHDRIELRLYGYIKAICQDHECHLLQIGGISNHIHLLVNLSRKHALSKFVNEIKSHSSKWIKTIDNDSQNFAWQSGYGAFSVGQLEYRKVIDYISKQKEHHKVISFQEEYLRFLKTYGMKYDEKYLWE